MLGDSVFHSPEMGDVRVQAGRITLHRSSHSATALCTGAQLCFWPVKNVQAAEIFVLSEGTGHWRKGCANRLVKNY